MGGFTPSGNITAPYNPSPYGGSPYGGGPSSTTRSGLAVAALVLGLLSLLLFVTFVVPLLAFIFGLVSASSIKRSHGRVTGIKQARAGWILGALGMAGFAAVIVAAVIDERNDTDVAVDELEVGVCYDLPISSDTSTVSSLEPIPCGEPHQGELYYQYEMNPDQDREYPGQDKAFEEAALECVGQPFTDYVGVAYEQSAYEPYLIVPLKFNWKIGGGQASCFVVAADESLITGSVRGSGD